jgi:hypothetical protein
MFILRITDTEMSSQPPGWTETIRRLRENDPTLTSVELTNGAVPASDAISHLCDSIRDNLVVKYVNLSRNRLKDIAGVQAIGSLLRNNTVIDSLDLSWNDFGPAAIAPLFDALLVNKSISTLKLEVRPRTQPSVEVFFFAMSLGNVCIFRYTIVREVGPNLLFQDPFHLFRTIYASTAAATFRPF